MQKISNKYTFFILMLISLSAFATEKIQSILGDERVIPPEPVSYTHLRAHET